MPVRALVAPSTTAPPSADHVLGVNSLILVGELNYTRRCRTQSFAFTAEGGVGEHGIGGAALLELARGVDEIMLVRALLEVEVALRAPWTAARRGSRREVQVIEDAACDEGIFDRGDQVHATVAARAVQDIEAHAPTEKNGPREPARTLGVVGRVGMAGAAGGDEGPAGIVTRVRKWSGANRWSGANSFL